MSAKRLLAESDIRAVVNCSRVFAATYQASDISIADEILYL